MILVDTSVWIDYLHKGDTAMSWLLESEAVLLHPFVFGEISLGSLKDRQSYLLELSIIPSASLVPDNEVHVLIEKQQLYGSGIGYVDAHLLASTLLGDNDLLWTKDRRLAGVAERLGIDASSA